MHFLVKNLQTKICYRLFSTAHDLKILVKFAPAEAFQEHFHKDKDINNVAFENLGKDAVLVIACPRSKRLQQYLHMVSYFKYAFLFYDNFNPIFCTF